MSMLNSPIKWMGGKFRLRKHIIELIPDDHTCYVEVCGGAGWVLFGKQPSQIEVYNDVNKELVNFYRVVKRHPEVFAKEVCDTLMAREIFESYKRADLSSMTDIERAVRFYYLVQLSFAAKMESFMIMPTRAPKDIHKHIRDNIAAIKQRLSRVITENRDFEKLITSYDRPTTFFYIDPPYVETEDYKTQGSGEFTAADHVRLRDKLAGIKGKFLLSLNDHPTVRELYKDFYIREVTVRYSINNRDHSGESGELFIANYEI